mgnify:FL=1|tara:strand:+ start:977 stop:1159 length:183 start_codon:yes stop_codon:yes gene_type:complete
MNKQMKELRKRLQNGLDTEYRRKRQGGWDYDVDLWIECMESVMWQLDWVVENIEDGDEEE